MLGRDELQNSQTSHQKLNYNSLQLTPLYELFQTLYPACSECMECRGKIGLAVSFFLKNSLVSYWKFSTFSFLFYVFLNSFPAPLCYDSATAQLRIRLPCVAMGAGVGGKQEGEHSTYSPCTFVGLRIGEICLLCGQNRL